MGHGKQSPRDKMIGLMYLFLTCMLALNVSKSILDAFININNGLNDTNANFINKNQIAYDAIDKAYASNPSKAKNAFDAAAILREKSDSLVKVMQYYKDTIIFYADGIPKENLFTLEGKLGYYRVDPDKEEDTIKLEGKVNNKDNSDVPAQIMVGQEGNPGSAFDLKKGIESYRIWALDIVENMFKQDSTSSVSQSIRTTLNTSSIKAEGHGDVGLVPWESHYFEHLPLMAVVTILTQMQAGVRNVEGDILNLMYGSLDAESFKFNKLEPIVLTNSTYVMRGNEYKAQIFLAAFDTTQAPIVQIGRVKEDAKGNLSIDNPQIVEIDKATNMATYKVKGGAVGQQKYQGLIKFPKPNSEDYITYKFESEYQVAEPSLVVSPTKMNVFYIGPKNPVKISVPGVSGDKITASITPATHGTIRKIKGDEYEVDVKRAGLCKVSVTADINGNKQNMGAVEFRIKSVPDPVASVLKQEGGDVAKSRLEAARTVDAKMKDFDFDLEFTVTQFTVSAKIGAYFVEERSTSERITQQMKQNVLSKVTKGTKVYFEDIQARGPDGKPRKLGVLLFKIQ